MYSRINNTLSTRLFISLLKQNNPLTISLTDLASYTFSTRRAACYLVERLVAMGIIVKVLNKGGTNQYVLIQSEENMKRLSKVLKDIKQNEDR